MDKIEDHLLARLDEIALAQGVPTGGAMNTAAEVEALNTLAIELRLPHRVGTFMQAGRPVLAVFAAARPPFTSDDPNAVRRQLEALAAAHHAAAG